MCEQYAFHKPLDDEGSDVLHGSFEYSGRRLLHFSLGLTCNFRNESHEIIRFDSSHNFVHVHRFYKKPKPVAPEKLDKEISWETVQELTKELKDNYLNWKKVYFKNHLGGV